MNIDALIALLNAGADGDYIGEAISQREHALQAADAAVRAGAPETLILASLLHDIGHWSDPQARHMPGLGVVDHERVGADRIRAAGLNEDIAMLVEMHVDAKRYRAATNAGYLRKLSPASTATLELQGGAMCEEEVSVFRSHPLFEDALRVRAWDEAAKKTDAVVPGVESYRAMLNRNRLDPLTDEQLSNWLERGFLHIRGWYNEREMVRIESVTDELGNWPETAGKWMKYFERHSRGDRQLCRIENFLQFSPVFDAICRGSSTLNLLSLLMDEPAELFKEKINFKLPAGQGFAPHQDAPAFASFGQDYHVTMMLSIDATTEANGCLEIARCGKVATLMDINEDLTLTREAVKALEWEPVETNPGDIVLFDSYLPHRSGPNQSNVSRRALYATYNRQAEGSYRETYFQAKRESFPPDIERVEGKHYDPGVFNVGNPVATE